MAYFTNKTFDAYFVIWKRTPVGTPERVRVESRMATMIMAMVKNYARHPFYCQYPEAVLGDFIAEGVMAIWVKLNGFEREKGTNYFAYFTTIAKNAFFAQLREYYKKKNKSVPMSVMENFLSEED